MLKLFYSCFLEEFDVLLKTSPEHRNCMKRSITHSLQVQPRYWGGGIRREENKRQNQHPLIQWLEKLLISRVIL